MNGKHADVSGLESASQGLTSLKSEISSIWAGSASNSYASQYDTVLASLTQVTNQIELFNVAVDKLEIYKTNKLNLFKTLKNVLKHYNLQI